MNSPQTENGFIQIATELQAALCRTRIAGSARQIFDIILLKTYGFHKKEDAISLSQFAKITGMSTSEVCRAIQKLLAMNLIDKKNGINTNIWYINKHYNTWVLAKLPVAKMVLTKKSKGTDKIVNQVLTKLSDTKDTSTKDTITKDIAAVAASGTKTIPPHLVPLAVFALATGVRFDNRDQLVSFIRRNLRASKSLAAYSPKQILHAYAVAYREAQKIGYQVTLETIGKKIDLYKNQDFDPNYQITCTAILNSFYAQKDILLSKSSPLLCSTISS